jgi:adhesin/invasin
VLRAVPILLLLTGCAQVLGIGEPGEAIVDLALTTVTVDVADGAIADGDDVVTVTVTVFDTTGRPMTGQTVVVSATPATGTEIDQPAPTTAAGVATASLTSTRAGTKTITATIDFEDADAQPAVTFVAGAPTQLVFLTPPSSTPAGEVIDPAVAVRVDDANGNPVTVADDTITLAIGANPSGGALSGTAVVDAVDGVAVFDDLAISAAGAGYTLVATAPSRTSTTSPAFTVTP